MLTNLSRAAILVLIVLSSLQSIKAQPAHTPATPKELYDKLAQLDSALFAIVYTCHPDQAANFFTEDLEFYHDKGGVTISRKTFLENLQRNFCGPAAAKLRRELVPGSLHVYPMDNYGALQVGEHRFYVTQNGQEKLTGIAKFTHLWQFKDNEWRISRVLSYDHQPAE